MGYHDTKNMSLLERFFSASRDLTHALETNHPFNDLDRLRLENHLAVLHMGYVEWKQRNGPLPDYMSTMLSEGLREDWEGDSHCFKQS